MIAFYPERVVEYLDQSAQDMTAEEFAKDTARRRAFMQRQVDERGLRAQLRSGSLLTGQLYVAFDYFPRAAKVKVDWKKATPELPVVPGTLVDLTMKLSSIADKIDRMPLEDIGATLKKDLESLDATLAAATKMVTNVDEQLVPALKTDLETLQRVLGNVERTLDNANSTLLGPNAPAQQELRDALTEFTRAARSLRVLLDYLERHPESPIRGKTDSKSGGK
jgi:paraquat-inducible protein B